MSVACAAEVFGRFLWEGDTSNKPLEWAGRLQLSASTPQATCLPLRGSVRRCVYIMQASDTDSRDPGFVDYNIKLEILAHFCHC